MGGSTRGLPRHDKASRMNRPWMPLYVADYLADTAHLNAAESGAYLHLIMHYWLNDALPDNEKQLARIARMTDLQWRTAKVILSDFFHEGWKHARIDAEIARAEVKHSRRSEAGKRGGIAKANAKQNPSNASGNALASSSQSERKEEDTADAVPPPASSAATYAFESGVIRLKKKDFDQWKQAFSHLDLGAELLALSEWAGQQGQKWFFAVSSALAKKNREVHARIEQQKTAPAFKWNGIEGVI